jgi:putative ABC transport system ATP-binding protein
VSTLAAADAADNVVTTSDLVVDYPTQAGVVRALESEALNVDGGSSVAVMGPSGCGKSTLLGLLAGLALPTSGRVTIGSAVVSELPDRTRTRFRREQIGVVYQADNLLPHLTVEENVALPLSIGRRDDADPQATRTLLERLGLGSLAPRLPDQLSGGERQRVAVARSVVHHPAVLLADEPTGALDADNARIVIELLTEVTRAIGATLIVVTHDPVIAEHLERTIHLVRPGLKAAEIDDAR